MYRSMKEEVCVLKIIDLKSFKTEMLLNVTKALKTEWINEGHVNMPFIKLKLWIR